MKRFTIIGVAVTALMLSACLATTDRQADAGKMVDRLYSALQQQDWNTALSLYGKQFYSSGMSREIWRKKLISLQQTMGPIESRTLVFSQHDPRFRYDAYIFSYRVKYARASTRETITIYKPVSGEQLHIVGHKITKNAITNQPG